MFLVNDPGPWQNFVLRGDNIGRPITEVTQKYLHEQLQFENFISMQQQLQLQQFQNKGIPNETVPPSIYTITIDVSIVEPGDIYRFTVGTNIGDSGVSIDWGDGETTETETLFPSTQFIHPYTNSGNYTVGITFTNPENIIRITSNQND